MKKLCLVLMTLIASQNVCFAEIKLAEEPKAAPQGHPLDSLVSCVIDKHEDVLNNLPAETGPNWLQPKAIYALAKQCKSTVEKVTKAINALEGERGLCPHSSTIEKYVETRLGQPFENNTVKEGPESFENTEFSMKLFMVGHEPTATYVPVTLIHATEGSTQQTVMMDQYMTSQEQKVQFSQAFSKAFDGKKPNSIYFAKDKLHCAYAFKSLPKSPNGGDRTKPVNGFMILDKPVDYHTLME